MQTSYTRFIAALSLGIFSVSSAISQKFFKKTAAATHWVDSVYQSLTPDQRLAQLMVVRESGIKDGKPDIYTDKVLDLVKNYNIGAVCLFQGTPSAQAVVLKKLQQNAKTPLMVCIDGETGLGMRMDGVEKFPDQLTIGAIRNGKDLVYKIGEAMARQCLRMGIQVNYAPVVDINNNPANPVIGYRSFGQDKNVVSAYGVAIMKGMQDEGIMACAKHFPGHGDVSVDSHLDLPVIQKSLPELEKLELIPFKKVFKAGIGSVMIAHLSIPQIDSTPHLASSLSHKFVTDLLRKKIGFQGLSFTDALEMKGVAKFFPKGEVAVMSLKAGNDMLCLPGDVATSIDKINEAISKGALSWADLEMRIKKVLYAKYHLGLNKPDPENIPIDHLLEDLNKEVTPLSSQVARLSLTAVKLDNGKFVPLRKDKKIAFLQIGGTPKDLLANTLRQSVSAKNFYLSFNDGSDMAADILQKIKEDKFDRIIITIGGFSKRPANNFQISQQALKLIENVHNYNTSTTLVVMGNPYALKNFTSFKNLLVSYEDGAVFQQAVADFLLGKAGLKGKLPVSVTADLPFGKGILVKAAKTIH